MKRERQIWEILSMVGLVLILTVLLSKVQASVTLVYQQVGLYSADDGVPVELIGTEKWAWVEVEMPEELPPLNYSYEKRMLDGGDYEIWIVAPGCEKKVSETKPDYIAYVEKGYEVKVIPFVEPSIEQLREQAELKAYSIRDIAMQAGFVYGEITIDTSLKAREIMSFAYAKAVENPEHVFNMILKDGTKVEITGADFVNIYQAMVTYGEALYNQCVQNIETIKTAEASQLKKFIKDGVWE